MGHLRQTRRRRSPRDMILSCPESHVTIDRGCSKSRWPETVEYVLEDSDVIVVQVCISLELLWEEPTSAWLGSSPRSQNDFSRASISEGVGEHDVSLWCEACGPS